jgi:hypothetical protein
LASARMRSHSARSALKSLSMPLNPRIFFALFKWTPHVSELESKCKRLTLGWRYACAARGDVMLVWTGTIKFWLTCLSDEAFD